MKSVSAQKTHMKIREKISRLLVRSSLYHEARARYARSTNSRRLEKWVAAGRPAPPPHVVKQNVLRETARALNLKVLVETGTYLGDMVNEMIPAFDRVYSIELSNELCELARRRFSGRDSVTILQGDSGTELLKLVRTVKVPILFWLDGHYSAGMTALGAKHTPIFEELEAIFSFADPGSAVVVDDARLFGSEAGYPSLDELFAFIKQRSPSSHVYVKHDSIRIVPAGSPPPGDFY